MSALGKPDFFYREAQRLGYVARSAFKLIQMQKQYNLIKPGSIVLDLGCAPGAWLQVACESLGPLHIGGAVVGIDLKKFRVPQLYCDERVQTICADVMKLSWKKIRTMSPLERGFSVVLSDMCPPVSGITFKDASLSMELGTQAVDLALGMASSSPAALDHDSSGVLLPGGNLVVKLLASVDVEEIRNICKQKFRKVSWVRPKATRSASKEVYLVCLGFKKKQ